MQTGSCIGLVVSASSRHVNDSEALHQTNIAYPNTKCIRTVQNFKK